MNFPETRHTLIRRLADVGQADDWRQFLTDYWGPVCRFAVRRASISAADAEDVASQVFEVLLTGQLLNRWVTEPRAKLRTLLCSVTRNVLSNRARVEQGRRRLLQEQAQAGNLEVFTDVDASQEQIDQFYASWVEDLLQRAVDLLLTDLHTTGKGDYFRVLYGRVCEELTMPEIAAGLGLKLTAAENYYKSARRSLSDRLEWLVREHVERYSSLADAEQEFAEEWRRVGEHLTSSGGLESVIRRAHATLEPAKASQHSARIAKALSRLLPTVP